MTLAELYREWIANGVEFGGVPMNGETQYMHRSRLGLLAIEELERQNTISKSPLLGGCVLAHMGGETIVDRSMYGNHGQVVNRPQPFEIDWDNPINEGRGPYS